MRQIVILALLPLLAGCTLNPALKAEETRLKATAQTASGPFEFDCNPVLDAQKRGETLVYGGGYNSLSCPSLDGRAALTVSSLRQTQGDTTLRAISVVLTVTGATPTTYSGQATTSSSSYSNLFRIHENTTFRASLSGGGEVKGSLSIGTE